MKCSINERSIYLLCDGLLNEKDRASLMEHCASCPRCKALYDEARQSLSVLKQPIPDTMFLSSEKEKSIIAETLARDAQPKEDRIVRFYRKKFVLVAAAALLLLSLVSGVYLLGGVRFMIPRPAPVLQLHAAEGTRIADLARDTTITFNRTCALLAEAGARVLLQQRSLRVVHFILTRGTVLIAAHKGLYDTIAVDCGPGTVLATGTHFSVMRRDSFVRVSVLEGAVKLLLQKPAPELCIETNEICTMKTLDGSWKKESLSPLLRRQLSDGFKAMNSVDFCMLQDPTADENQVLENTTAITPSAKTGYDKIRRMIRAGDYKNAISGILKHLETDTIDADVSYCDLALCYSNVNQWQNAINTYAKAASLTRDSLVREAILHRTNHILFSKLTRYEDAKAGIVRYLANYPRGSWREREFGMLMRLEFAQKHHAEARKVMARFRLEFPASRSMEGTAGNFESAPPGNSHPVK